MLGISHTLQVTGEAVQLNYSAPAGISIYFSPSNPVMVPATAGVNVTMIVSAGKSVVPGNYTITVNGTAGQYTQSSSFNLRVVQYRVVMVRNTFTPGALNVTVGSTVYWQNVDGPSGTCGSTGGTGLHNVVFTTIPVNSSTVKQYGVFSYTFNTPGSYFYYSSLDSGKTMNGTINVVSSGGGVGMRAIMPSFSYFKGGSVATPVASGERQASPQSSSQVSSVALVFASLAALAAVPVAAVLSLRPRLEATRLKLDAARLVPRASRQVASHVFRFLSAPPAAPARGGTRSQVR